MNIVDKIATEVFTEMMDDHADINRDTRVVMIAEYACCHLEETGAVELAKAIREIMRELYKDLNQ